MNVRKIVDVIMFLLLLCLMAFHQTGRNIHEILGMIMIICFVVHHILNYRWYKTIFKGKMNSRKLTYSIINTLLLVCIFILCLSGLTMSRLLPFLNFMPIAYARSVHMLTGYWGFIIMAVHLGLHIQVMCRTMQKRIESQHNLIKITMYYGVPFLLSIVGMIMFLKNDFLTYLLLGIRFSSFEESTFISFIMEYLSVFILFVIMTHFVFSYFVSTPKKKESNKNE
ncbi:MAG: DUF4405 domain-containing protein [Coprobacillaceae bacterium]